jgi:hypothetical protein
MQLDRYRQRKLPEPLTDRKSAQTRPACYVSMIGGRRQFTSHAWVRQVTLRVYRARHMRPGGTRAIHVGWFHLGVIALLATRRALTDEDA